MRFLCVILALSVFLAVASCKRQQAKSTKIYHGVGVIESVDRNAHTININHEEIKDYMAAMSMLYKVRKKVSLDSIQPGDHVEFTIQDGDLGAIITEIKKQ